MEINMEKRMTFSGLFFLISFTPRRNVGISNMAWMKKTNPMNSFPEPMSL